MNFAPASEVWNAPKAILGIDFRGETICLLWQTGFSYELCLTDFDKLFALIVLD